MRKRITADDLHLAEVALKAKKKAFTLWGFKVGAAVLTSDGKSFEGCNIESRISGLGVCAERCAIDHAVLHGGKSIAKIAVVIDRKDCPDPTPCGACLQYIDDFSQGNAEVITAEAENGRLLLESIKVRCIRDLLPCPLTPVSPTHD